MRIDNILEVGVDYFVFCNTSVQNINNDIGYEIPIWE